eukprot:XP_001707836.1 Hypothetical protein GL50803_32125 [Giardia lamblia ATCC 50803]
MPAKRIPSSLAGLTDVIVTAWDPNRRKNREFMYRSSIAPGGRSWSLGGFFSAFTLAYWSTPQSAMTTFSTGLSLAPVFVVSIALTTSIPSRTRPKTTCLPSSQAVSATVRKN